MLTSVFGLLLAAQTLAAQTPAGPPVTVADLIAMSWFGSDPHNGGSEDDALALAPDGSHLAVLLQRGDIDRNLVVYTLVVFATADIGPGTRPDTVAALTSASNEPAISKVHWLSDSRRIAFLGQPMREPAQVYTVDIVTHTLTARTHSATGVTSFEIAPPGEPVIYQEQSTIDTTRYAARRARGFALSPKARLSDVIAGDWVDSGPKWVALRGVKGYRITRGGTDVVLALPDSTTGHKNCELQSLHGSPFGPRGDAVMLICEARTIPPMWKAYRDPGYRLWIDKFEDYGRELVVLDLASGKARLAFTAPLTDEANYAWAPDGRSLLVASTLLPLTGPDSARRVSRRMAAEIDLGTGAITVIAARDSLVIQRWDERTGIVDCAVAFNSWLVTGASEHVYYRKTTRGWQKVSGRAAGTPPRFIIDQGLNTPPRLAVVDPTTHANHVVFDPNPGFPGAHRLGRVEVFHWTNKRGMELAGGLYYPPDYVPGRRYPLVLQTHGFDSTRFAPDGIFTTDEAAQPLAGAGIVVLQMLQRVRGDSIALEAVESPAEAPLEQETFEGAIDALDGRGLIDRARVALEGFSRSCFYTLYFLTHSSYPIAAADIADGLDYSYFQSLAFTMHAERVNGGPPWGSTQAAWLERAPGFRLDRVTAPLRLTALTGAALLEEWEPYAGLLLQGKAAEMVYIPDGSHILVKPWERLTSQQGVVDWWRFWLQDHQDPDPAKAEQYARWRQLRAQRDASVPSTSR